MIDIRYMDDIEKINENIEYFDDIIKLSVEAKNYLNSFDWCRNINRGWLAQEWGYVLCVFYFEITPRPDSKADNFVWIVVGDLPTVYIDIESATNVKEVLESYIFLMQDWIDQVNNGKSIDNCYPIEVKPTKKMAKMLEGRIKIIKDDFINQL